MGLLLLVASFLQMAIISHYKLESFEKYTHTHREIHPLLSNTSSWLPCECLAHFFKNVIYLEIFLCHLVPPQAISEFIALEMVVNEDRRHSQIPGYCFHFSMLAFASGSVKRLRRSLPTAGSFFLSQGSSLMVVGGGGGGVYVIGTFKDTFKDSISYKCSVECGNIQPNK